MKPFVVAVFHENNVERFAHFRVRVAEQTGIIYRNREINESMFNGGFDNQCQLYFCDHEDDARQTADHLTTRFPGQKVLVAKTSEVFYREMGPSKSAKFSDKGLMP